MQICASNPVRHFLSMFAVLAALALVACGGDDGGGSGPDPATLAPADAPIYFEAVVRPEGEMKDGALDALGKLLNSDDPGAAIREQIESGLSSEDAGLSYSEDIEPWLGERAGFFLTDFDGGDGNGAAAVEVTDQDAAEAAIAKAAEADGGSIKDATYEGVSYKTTEDDGAYGFVDDFLVAGTVSGFEAAVDASGGESISSDSATSDALATAPEDSLFSGLVDAERVVDLAVEAGELSREDLKQAGDQLEQLQGEPIVFSGAAEADSISFEASGPEGVASQSSDIVATLPGEAWLALGATNFGESIGTTYQQFLAGFQRSISQAGLPTGEVPDIQGEIQDQLGLDPAKDFAWAGDLGLFVQGTSLLDLGGALVIETDDEAAATEAVNKLQKALQRNRSLQVTGSADGFEIASAQAPVGAEVAVRDGKVVVAAAGVTVDDALSPSESLADSDAFTSATGALGDGLDPAFFVDFPTIVSLIEGSGQASGPEYEQAKPVLDALDYLVAGGGEQDGRAVGRFVLGLREPGSSSGQASVIAP